MFVYLIHNCCYLQAITLKSYPAELSLTAWMCSMGTVQGSFVALAIEWRNPSAWSIKSGSMLLAALYSVRNSLHYTFISCFLWNVPIFLTLLFCARQGVFRSGFAYYIQGIVLKERGPVFVSAFNPVGLVIVAILSSFILGEMMYLGR